mgnify:CR=1 FL=1
MGMIKKVNIRATTDHRFWGDEYEASLYLFESAKHDLSLKELAAVTTATLEDPFQSSEEIRNAHDYCRAVYYKYLGILAKTLNEMHGLDMPEMFWRTALGVWLYRHISIAYDKYTRLQRVDIDETSINLLALSSYYVPNDHLDYVRYFCNDTGVMQLASQYYSLFGYKEHPSIAAQAETFRPQDLAENHHANLMILPPGRIYSDVNRDIIAFQQNAQIALCSAYYSDQVLHDLTIQSRGKVCNISLPPVAVYEKPLDMHKRFSLANQQADNAFERYLVNTLSSSMPKILVEYFRDYYDCYASYVDNCSHRAIVTECWCSFFPVSIYCAVARQRHNVSLIFQQHGASLQWLECDLLWLELEVADRFITTGWQGDSEKHVAGGFAIRESLQHRPEACHSGIIHVCTTRLPYLLSFGEVASGGPRFVSYLKGVDEFIEMMPARLKGHYVLRPRRAPFFWDTEHAWGVGQRGIRIEAEGDLLSLMLKAKLVVIDHMSTALGEILYSRIPFIMLYFEEFESLADQFSGLFDDLIACGVVHKSPRSAIEHLDKNYDTVQEWWQSEPVQNAVSQLRDASLADPQKTKDYLLSVMNNRDSLRNRLASVNSKISFLPKTDILIQKMHEHLGQMLIVLDGETDQEGYLKHAALSVVDPGEEIAFCRSLLELLKIEPAGDTLRAFINNLIQTINAVHLPLRPSTNPLHENQRFEYGSEFQEFICPNPFLYAELQHGGEITCCCYLPFSLGNISKNAFGDIWNSAAAQELRRSMLSGEFCYCDKNKCSAMQEALLLLKKDTFHYQTPYRLMKRGQIENDLVREALVSGSLIIDSGPEIISFEDDPSCNLSCPSCRTGLMTLTPEQSQQRVEADTRLLDAAGPQLKELWFSGAGDPLASSAYRKIFQSYDFAKFPNIRFRLDTNGVLFNEHTWTTVLGKINQRIRLIAVSVDAANEETYNSIRRGGNFRALLEHLRFIAGLPERKRGLAFIIRMIVQRKNYQEMRQFVELGRFLGVDAVVFSVMQNWGTFTASEYQQEAIHLPTHPEHKELCSILRDPVFKDPLVNLGNLIELYSSVAAHADSTVEAAPVTEMIAARQTVPAPQRRARVIAFYLPQFHPIPENDMWWGKGFTEWTNVGKAKPLFEGHYQPHVPADLGYYDLRVPETRKAQAELARQYDIEAFCYWHYWFGNGKRLLERPFEEVVRSGEPDFPFCLGWANQTWSGIWHGAPDRMLIEQTYPGQEDYKAHFNALLPAFRDSRYLKVNGKLLFLIYAPYSLPDARFFTNYWQGLAHEAGLNGFHFVAHLVRSNPEQYGCDSCVEGAPFVHMDAPELKIQVDSPPLKPKVFHYAELVRYSKNLVLNPGEYPLVMPNWDNTPRSGVNGLVLHGSTPELFREMMEDAVAKVEPRQNSEERIIFVKAWNEWAEGNHLEPDLLYGHAYLNALQESLLPKKANSNVSAYGFQASTISCSEIKQTGDIPIPWTTDYYNYRACLNEKILHDDSLLYLFQHGFQLPDNFAVGLDERSVEYPWFMAVSDKTARRILDAGSALNHAELLGLDFWRNKELSIVTLAPEANQFKVPWLNYVYSDLRSLPFEDNYFDEIACISTLEHVGMDNTKFVNSPDYKEHKSSDYIKALLEMHRVLKPGGRLLLTVPFGKHLNYFEFQQFDKEMIDKCREVFAGKNCIERFYLYTRTGWKLAGSAEECANLEYSSYAIESSWGAQSALCPLDEDGAVAARAVACCVWEKRSNS